VNVPEPVQPELPVNVQVPEIVLPFAVPERVNVLPDGLPDCTTIPNLPFTCPLKLPLSVNAPLSVSPDTKQGELVVKLKFVTVSDPSPFVERDVPKANAVVLLLPINVAFHVPLMLAGFEFEPHPTRAKPTASKMKTANCFISKSLGVRKSEGALSD
jgi:hypothetical protein